MNESLFLPDLLNKIFNEDCRVTMKRIPDNSIDSIVTDAPYELGFMGKAWDSSGIAYNVAMWSECLRILKPGGYLLAFGGTRTSHRMVCAIEDAGFEIRDSIMWIYGTGFPKSLDIAKAIEGNLTIGSSNTKDQKKLKGKTYNVSSGQGGMDVRAEYRDTSYQRQKTDVDFTTSEAQQWSGWGTALKPAHEPICVARKPLSEKTVASNVLKYSTGGINIDASRIGGPEPHHNYGRTSSEKSFVGKGDESVTPSSGRFPANIILDEFTAELLDKQAPDTGAFAPVKRGQKGKSKGVYGDFAQKGDDGDSFYDDKGAASRFFYIAKASSHERNDGLYQFEKMRDSDRSKTNGPGGANPRNRTNSNKNNFHPTVKPVKLIQYLQKLVTPPGGIVYDPFGGSGTSAPAAQNNGFKWIMSELIKEHYDIAVKRIYNNGGLWL